MKTYRGAGNEADRRRQQRRGEEEMTWTTNWPTKSGFYWIRNFVTNEGKDRGRGAYPHPRVVWLDRDFDIYYVGTDAISRREDMASAEWYGPIEPPGENS